jgi:hypothetical protein
MTTNSYSDYGPAWTEAIIDQLDGQSFEIGIESDKKQRGSAVNCEVMDQDQNAGLFVLCVRKSDFHPRRFTRTRKDYFLCGKNENGNAFAHPVDVIATNARVEVALCRIWGTTPSVLPHIVRQGDVAVIPERGITYKDVERLPAMEFTIDSATDSHVFTPGALYSRGSTFYVAESIQIRHVKGQHPFVAARLNPSKLYRVQVGNRARTWGFARPTAD